MLDSIATCILIAGILGGLASDALAQNSLRDGRPQTQSAPTSRLKTTVSMELLVPVPSAFVDAQRWGEALSRFGVTVQSRQQSDAKPDIRERKQGTLRFVQVTAVLQRAGGLAVPGRVFTLDNQKAVEDWIRELQTYGAQGRPDGQPAYGLSPQQFEKVFRELEQPVEGKSQGKPFDESLATIGLPQTLSLRLSAEAVDRRRKLAKTWSLSGELNGFSRGTALAIVLSQAGLAFRPGRTPDGDLELVAVPLEEPGVWPIGWPLDQPPLRIVPTLVEIIPIEFDDTPLADVFAAASESTEVRIFTDDYRISAKGINLHKTLVSHNPKKTMWSLALQQVIAPHHLVREVLVDEAGAPFVWITTLDPKQLNEREKQRQALQEQKERRP